MRISDWSSDVCSSGLHGLMVRRAQQSGRSAATTAGPLLPGLALEQLVDFAGPLLLDDPHLHLQRRGELPLRSEEPREGKGCVSTCRSRCSPDHSKKTYDTDP